MTLLASMDQDGYCHFSALENLAARAHVSLAKARRAVECFEAPDPNSENLANEGRRIERVPGGYLVLNAVHYRNKFTREIEREQTRLRVEKYRKRHQAKKGESNEATVTKALQGVSPASVSSSVSDSVSKRKPENLNCCLRYATSIGISNSDATAFFDSMEAGGWTRNGKALKDWEAHLRSYKAQGWLASQKQHRKPGSPLDDKFEREQLEWEERKKRGEIKYASRPRSSDG